MHIEIIGVFGLVLPSPASAGLLARTESRRRPANALIYAPTHP
jgi:hypothetical protein